jgi:molecular chaperone DnaK
MKPVIGIDLGTTFSAVSHIDPDTGRAEILADPETQERITPSVVMFETENNVIVGKIAKLNAVAKPGRIVEFVKRQMGKPKQEPPHGWSFTMGNVVYSAQEISAFILKKLKQDAERRLGQTVDQAVITVPAYFGEPQRAATAEAARIAGLEVLRIIDEPVAAALAYGLDRLDQNQTVFVFDLGGGTLDVTIIAIKDKAISELAIDGDHELGGKDWDNAIIEHAAGQFRAKFGTNPLDDLHAYQDLQLRAISAKEQLSRAGSSNITVGYAGNQLFLDFSREQFEALTKHLVDRCRSRCDAVMYESGKSWQEIDRVLLVGGSTRMPMIRQMIEEISGKKPSTDEINPDECVAQGAAWQATLLQIQEKDPAIKREWAVLNPALVERLQAVRVTKITAHPLGATAIDHATSELRSFLVIPKGTACPCDGKKSFATRFDNQAAVEIDVTEGGAYLSGTNCDPSECRILGQVQLSGIPPLPSGSPIEVTYRFTEDGLLEAAMRHTPSGRTGTAAISHPAGLTEQQMADAIQRRITVTSY